MKIVLLLSELLLIEIAASAALFFVWNCILAQRCYLRFMSPIDACLVTLFFFAFMLFYEGFKQMIKET